MNFLALKAVPVTTVVALVVIADLVSFGGVVVAAIGVVVAAIVAYFTIRNLQRSYWRNLVDERDAEIVEMRRVADDELQKRALFAEEQRDLRHQLKTALATATGQLEVERSKHDLTAVLTKIDVLESSLIGADRFDALNANISRQADTLEAILDALRNTTTS